MLRRQGIWVVAFGVWVITACAGAPVSTPAAQATPPASPTVAPPPASPTPLPTPTPKADTAECPTDPDQWRLVEYPKEMGMGNLRGIDPPCVYDQIARTAAWRLLTADMGWTVEEANQALGFVKTPEDYPEVLTVTTNLKTGWVIRVFGYAVQHPEYRQWSLNRQGQPSGWIVLRGCFRGQDYALPWRVVCEAWEGLLETQHYLNVFRDIRSRRGADRPSMVYPIYFGYAGDGRWVYLGAEEHPNRQGLYVLLEDSERIRHFLAQGSAPLPVGVWDAMWVEKTFGLTMKPLPEGWKTWPDRTGEILREVYPFIGRK